MAMQGLRLYLIMVGRGSNPMCRWIGLVRTPLPRGFFVSSLQQEVYVAGHLINDSFHVRTLDIHERLTP